MRPSRSDFSMGRARSARTTAASCASGASGRSRSPAGVVLRLRIIRPGHNHYKAPIPIGRAPLRRPSVESGEAIRLPAPTHTCPKCTPENPCYFSEGEIVSLRDAVANEARAPWTGIVLDVERDRSGRVYRVLWGPPPSNLGASAAIAAKYSGQHRRDELVRFLVP